MEITGIKVVATDEEIAKQFKEFGFNVYKKTFQYEEKCYHNRYEIVTETKWVVEDPKTKKTLPMRDKFNEIINKHLSISLLSGITKEFVIMNFNK